MRHGYKHYGYIQHCSIDTSAWVTQLESPKGVKEEVQQARMVN